MSNIPNDRTFDTLPTQVLSPLEQLRNRTIMGNQFNVKGSGSLQNIPRTIPDTHNPSLDIAGDLSLNSQPFIQSQGNITNPNYPSTILQQPVGETQVDLGAQDFNQMYPPSTSVEIKPQQNLMAQPALVPTSEVISNTPPQSELRNNQVPFRNNPNQVTQIKNLPEVKGADIVKATQKSINATIASVKSSIDKTNQAFTLQEALNLNLKETGINSGNLNN